MSFKYVDLFAGIGGFHAALSALGGECVMASEIDTDAVKIYRANWGELSNELRIMFIRSPKFNYLQFEDIDIVNGLFQQHKKFDSVKEHLYHLQLSTTSNDLVDWEFDSIFTGPPEDVLLAVDDEDDASVIHLSSQVGIDIDWNPDELDSEAILGLTGTPDEF